LHSELDIVTDGNIALSFGGKINIILGENKSRKECLCSRRAGGGRNVHYSYLE
jgi:hypothetical protein